MSRNRRGPTDTESASMWPHHDDAAGPLVHRYLLGRLAADEAARFEEHYLDCPECLAELEAAEGLHRGLRGLAAKQAAGAGMMAAAAWLRHRRAAWAGAALALVALVAAGLLGLREAAWRNEPPPARAPSANTVVAYLGPLRSAGEAAPPSIHRPPDGGWVVLALDLGAAAGQPLRLALYREGEAVPLWRGGDPVAAGALGELTVSVPAELLTPGRYRAEVSAAGEDPASTVATTLPFEVVAAGAAGNFAPP